MAEKRTKRVGCLLWPEQHRLFKIACARLGITMVQVIENAIDATIAEAEKETGDGHSS